MAASSGAGSTEWALPDPPPDSELMIKDWKSTAYAAMDKVKSDYGGPGKYFEHHLMQQDDDKMMNKAAVSQFADWLHDTFPEREEVFYHTKADDLPWVNEKYLATSVPLAIPVYMLGWSKEVSLKPRPGGQVFEALIDQFLTDGFVTSGEPLLITLPRELQNQQLEVHSIPHDPLKIEPFAIGYVKGQARVSTLMTLLHWAYTEGHDLKVLHPTLYQSICTIYCHPMKCASKVDEAMLNNKLSTRGSIRKSNNIIQTVIMVINLGAYGLSDIGHFVRKWNGQSGKTDAIVGKRATSLKLLFESAPRHVLNSILDFVQTCGWDCCCWSDDNLANKKIYPKHQFPSKSKTWTPRVKTTEESMALMVKRAQHLHTSLPTYQQKKLDAQSCEEMAEKAAAIMHIAEEVQRSAPIAQATIQKEWLDVWAQGGHVIDMEIQSALLDKSDDFDPAKHLPSLKVFIDKHVFERPVCRTAVESEALAIDEWDLLQKQFAYDIQVFHNWQKKCANAVAAVFHKEMEHKIAIKKACQDAATHFMRSCIKLVTWSTSHYAIAEIMNFKRDTITARTGFQDNAISHIPLLNWSAPCTIKDQIQQHEIDVLSWALAENMQSCAIVLAPVFSYNKGRVHLEEQKMVKLLANANHNIDCQMVVLFTEQCDQRDDRPMVHPGRLIFPSSLPRMQNMFYSSSLRKHRRTDEVKQIPGQSMKCIED